MAQHISSLPAGTVVGEYRIERVLGVGGFGLTYLATDTNLDLPVALKEYFPAEIAVRGAPHLDGDEANESLADIFPASEDDRPTFQWGLARFLDEARTLAAFRHPNIVRVMRFFQANRSAYMVMEFVRGADLSQWAKSRRPLDDAALLAIAKPVLEGLAVIHQAGFIHRDVKPGNIYMREDASPVLLDFGAARSQLGKSGNGEMTAVVSPGYAPVEQYSESSPQGPWSDLYAMGGVMYWLVTGNKPVDATARLRNDPQPKAVDIGDVGRFSPRVLAAIDWALTPDEAARPQSVRALLAALTGQSESADAAPSGAEATLPLAHMKTLPKSMPSASLLDVGAVRRLPSEGHTTPETIDAEQLREIEVELAERIGPLASVLVRKAAKRSANKVELVEAVSREIDDEGERTRFTQRMSGNSQPVSGGRTPLSSEPLTALALRRFDLAVLEKAERRLARHLGAVARVIVKKAAVKARDEKELYLLLADEIDDATDRKEFIRKAIALSGSA
jgi:serine/threonine protein kinase